MRPSSQWKSVERWWSKKLGGVRVPITGRQRGSAPDIEHPDYAVEVKYGRMLSSRMQTALEQASMAAAGTTKTPLVCISHARKGPLGNVNVVMMYADDWLELAGLD